MSDKEPKNLGDLYIEIPYIADKIFIFDKIKELLQRKIDEYERCDKGFFAARTSELKNIGEGLL